MIVLVTALVSKRCNMREYLLVVIRSGWIRCLRVFRSVDVSLLDSVRSTFVLSGGFDDLRVCVRRIVPPSLLPIARRHAFPVGGARLDRRHHHGRRRATGHGTTTDGGASVGRPSGIPPRAQPSAITARALFSTQLGASA